MRCINRDRMHQYSRKFSGSHADRRKFLAKRQKRKPVDGDDADSALTPVEDINALPSIGEIRRSDTPLRNRKGGKKSAIESAVEDAIDKTL